MTNRDFQLLKHERKNMPTGVDPSFWKWLLDNIWMPLTGAVGIVWAMLNARIARIEAKSEGAIQREDFKEHLSSDKEAHEEIRQHIVRLFENAETDRKETRESFAELKGCIHSAHVDLLGQIHKRGGKQ